MCSRQLLLASTGALAGGAEPAGGVSSRRMCPHAGNTRQLVAPLPPKPPTPTPPPTVINQKTTTILLIVAAVYLFVFFFFSIWWYLIVR